MIDEKKLLKDFKDFEHLSSGQFKTFMEVIVTIVKAHPKVGEWIPVSERLPEEDGKYLCQMSFGNHNLFDVCSFAKNLFEIDEYDFFENHYAGFYELDSEYGYYEVNSVVAWMPLPDPYKGD